MVSARRPGASTVIKSKCFIFPSRINPRYPRVYRHTSPPTPYFTQFSQLIYKTGGGRRQAALGFSQASCRPWTWGVNIPLFARNRDADLASRSDIDVVTSVDSP